MSTQKPVRSLFVSVEPWVLSAIFEDILSVNVFFCGGCAVSLSALETVQVSVVDDDLIEESGAARFFVVRPTTYDATSNCCTESAAASLSPMTLISRMNS